MNKVLLIGRLTRDPEVRYGGENKDKAVALILWWMGLMRSCHLTKYQECAGIFMEKSVRMPVFLRW